MKTNLTILSFLLVFTLTAYGNNYYLAMPQDKSDQLLKHYGNNDNIKQALLKNKYLNKATAANTLTIISAQTSDKSSADNTEAEQVSYRATDVVIFLLKVPIGVLVGGLAGHIIRRKMLEPRRREEWRRFRENLDDFIGGMQRAEQRSHFLTDVEADMESPKGFIIGASIGGVVTAAIFLPQLFTTTQQIGNSECNYLIVMAKNRYSTPIYLDPASHCIRGEIAASNKELIQAPTDTNNILNTALTHAYNIPVILHSKNGFGPECQLVFHQPSSGKTYQIRIQQNYCGYKAGTVTATPLQTEQLQAKVKFAHRGKWSRQNGQAGIVYINFRAK